MTEKIISKKMKFINFLYCPFFMFILFGLVYLIYFLINQDSIIQNAAIQDGRILDFAKKFGNYLGFGFGLISLLLTGIVLLVKRFFAKKRIRLLNSLLFIIFFGGWAGMGYRLLYYEPRNTDLGIGIIELIGNPLYIAGIVVLGVSILGLVLSFIPLSTNKQEKGKDE